MTSPEPTHLDPDLAGTWTLDPARTSVDIRTKAMWVLPVKGTARAVRGSGTVDADGTVTGNLVLDATSVDTGNKRRDAHLQSSDFLEAATYPTITFAVHGARPSGEGKVALDGSLTMRGQTRPVSLLATVARAGDALTLWTEAGVDRSDWGMRWAKLGTAVQNAVTIRAHFDRA